MSLDATIWAWKQQVKPATLKIILLSLADRCGEDFTAFPSAKRLELDTCLNIKTIEKGMIKLVEMGLIYDTGERKGRTKSVKVYRLAVNQKREAPPIFPDSSPNNGGSKLPQNRGTESPIILTPQIEPKKDNVSFQDTDKNNLVKNEFENLWCLYRDCKNELGGKAGVKSKAYNSWMSLFRMISLDKFKAELDKIRKDLRGEFNECEMTINKGLSYNPFLNLHFSTYISQKRWEK